MTAILTSPRFDLEQVQTEYREANSYIETGNQLQQEGYAAEAASCSDQAVALYRHLIDQLLNYVKTDKSLMLGKQADLSPKQRIDRFEALRQQAAHCLNQGKQLEQEGKLDEAAESYYEAIRIDPNLPWSYHSLGDIFTKKGQWNEAMNCYCECIQLSPETPWSYHALGDTLSVIGNSDEALFFYHRAISLKLDLCWTHNALGNLYAQRGDFEKAAHHYRMALEIEPTIESAKASLATVLERLEG
jgi:tetratricopeptide (TPR) repeat protein